MTEESVKGEAAPFLPLSAHRNIFSENGPATAHQRLVLAVLVRHANRAGVVAKIAKEIAVDAKLAHSTTREVLQQLESDYWIAICPGNGRTRSTYTVLADLDPDARRAARGSAGSRSAPPAGSQGAASRQPGCRQPAARVPPAGSQGAASRSPIPYRSASGSASISAEIPEKDLSSGLRSGSRAHDPAAVKPAPLRQATGRLPEEHLTPAGHAILAALRGAAEGGPLAQIATTDLAHQLAGYTDQDGHTGRLRLDDVLFCLQNIEAGEMAARSTPEGPRMGRSLTGYIVGTITKLRRGVADEPAGGGGRGLPQRGVLPRQPAPAGGGGWVSG